MSEHPELREEVVAAVQRWADDAGGYAREDIEELAAYLFDRLAGPVGKLQAELADLRRNLVLVQTSAQTVTRMNADLKRQLAEAQAELVQLREEKACQFVIRSDEGTAYCSLAERSDPEHIRREAIGAWVQKCVLRYDPDECEHTVGLPHEGMDIIYRAFDLVEMALAAGESAVTGEADESDFDRMIKARTALLPTATAAELGIDPPVTGEAT